MCICVFFATAYHLCILHNSYLISDLGAGNISLPVLIMPFYFILSNHHLYVFNIQFLDWQCHLRFQHNLYHIYLRVILPE